MTILEEIANEVEREILATRRLNLGGVSYTGNSLRKDSPLAGFCHLAVAKIIEIVPQLDLTVMSFKYQLAEGKDFFSRSGTHTIAEVCESGEKILIDPTLRQYLPGADRLVYQSEEIYPLWINKESILRTSKERFKFL